MSLNPSPTKSNQMRTSVDRNIRINLNSKYIPSDFFPASISQINSCSRKSSFESPLGRPRIASMVAGQATQKCFNRDQWRNLQSLRKKLIQIQRNSDQQRENIVSKSKQIANVQRKSNNINSSKKRKQSNTSDESNRKQSKLNLKNRVCKITKSKCKIQQATEYCGVKNLSKNYNQYLQKIKKVINIDLDIKLVDTSIKQPNPNGCSTQISNPQKYHAVSLKKHESLRQRQHKQSMEELDTTNQSPKVPIKVRPKSELDSRQRLLKRNKISIFPHQRVRKISVQRNSFNDRLKVKVQQIQKKSSQVEKRSKQKSLNKNERYVQTKKFSDINLDQDGMLTFHGQFNSPQKSDKRNISDKQKISKRIALKKKINETNYEGRKSLSDIPNYNYRNYIGRNSLPRIQKSLK